MKKLAIIFCLISISIRATSDTLPTYCEGTILNVYASSGMKLRAFPNKNAEVLDIVRYGDKVEVINTFAFSADKTDRIDWLDGHWILVEYDGIAGYLFDAYLSALPFPGSEEEICQDGYSYAYTLGTYFDRNFSKQQVLDSSTNKIVYLLDKGIKVKRMQAQDVWTIEIEIPQIGIHEILNLMRSMLPDKSSQIQFENALIFIEGPDAKINEIKVNIGDSVTLKKKANGHLLVKASGASGC
jgi:hypothetical protein